MTMQKTGIINRKDGRSTLNYKCECGRVHRATATLSQVTCGPTYSCGVVVQPTVDLEVEELSLHVLSPAGEGSVIADAVRQAGPQDGPKHWIPRLNPSGTWGIVYSEGDGWEGDGGPFTYTEARRLATWLNEQEAQEAERCK